MAKPRTVSPPKESFSNLWAQFQNGGSNVMSTDSACQCWHIYIYIGISISEFYILWIRIQHFQTQMIDFINISKIILGDFFMDILQMPAFHFCPRITLVWPQIGCRPRALLIFLNHICCATHCNADFSHISLIFLEYSTHITQAYLFCNVHPILQCGFFTFHCNIPYFHNFMFVCNSIWMSHFITTLGICLYIELICKSYTFYNKILIVPFFIFLHISYLYSGLSVFRR